MVAAVLVGGYVLLLVGFAFAFAWMNKKVEGDPSLDISDAGTCGTCAHQLAHPNIEPCSSCLEGAGEYLVFANYQLAEGEE